MFLNQQLDVTISVVHRWTRSLNSLIALLGGDIYKKTRKENIFYYILAIDLSFTLSYSCVLTFYGN